MPRPVTYTSSALFQDDSPPPPEPRAKPGALKPADSPAPAAASPSVVSEMTDPASPSETGENGPPANREDGESGDSGDREDGESGDADDRDTEVWVRLARADLSARRLRRLLGHYGRPEAALGASAKELHDLGLNAAVAERFVASATAPLKSELQLIRSRGIKVIPFTHPDYPAPLAQIYDPPVVLFVRGELTSADAFSVAVVGSRRATAYGRGVAERLARELSEVGFTLISGVARGVDTAAHQGALSAGGR
ncbi:MAG: DNA-protecting protein DprA, partial [Armatimonadetes bacterium]|nr:DNA-protecting protein DprA [Armatimonadota bacterium]